LLEVRIGERGVASPQHLAELVRVRAAWMIASI
jgi:hypothetical protein